MRSVRPVHGDDKLLVAPVFFGQGHGQSSRSGHDNRMKQAGTASPRNQGAKSRGIAPVGQTGTIKPSLAGEPGRGKENPPPLLLGGLLTLCGDAVW